MITFLLFAGLRERAGTSSLQLDLPADATIADAWSAACSCHPELSAWTGRLAFARNGVYAAPETRVSAGDEVAAIPPVSGG